MLNPFGIDATLKITSQLWQRIEIKDMFIDWNHKYFKSAHSTPTWSYILPLNKPL